MMIMLMLMMLLLMPPYCFIAAMLICLRPFIDDDESL